MSRPASQGHAFGGYRLDPIARQLLDGSGGRVALTPKAFDVLLYLVEHRERVVDKNELLDAVWAGRVVEENSLTQAVSAIRRALGTGAGDHRYVVTVPGRGYCFVAGLDDPAPEQAAVAGADAERPIEGRQDAATRRQVRLLAWSGVVASLAALALFFAVFRDTPERAVATATPRPAPPTLAVLPFHAVGGERRDDLIELGMAETLISRLSDASSLRVLSLGAVQDYAGRNVDPVRTGVSLGADYVVDGSFQRVGERLRVNVRLVEVPGGRALWTGAFDQSPDQMFTLRDAVAEGMAPALSPYMSGAGGRHRSPCDGADADAYRAYLRGVHLMNRPERDTLPRAIASLRAAVERDPACARAWAAMAFAYRAQAMTADGEPRVVFPLALEAVGNALRIDPASAQAHASKGFIEFWYGWDWAAAERSLREAIRLDDNLPEAHFALAHLLNNTGRLDEALPYARKATSLDPMSPIMNTVVASFFINDGQVEEGVRRLDDVLRTDPDFWVALMIRGAVRLGQGDVAKAFPELRAARKACGGCSVAEVMLARAHVAMGDTAAARDTLRALQRRRAGVYVPATRIAALHLALGERAAALDELERAYRERDVLVSFLAIDGAWQGLHEEPRFRALLDDLRLSVPPGS